MRLRDIAASLVITDRSAYGIATDLTAAGYVVKQKDSRRNRYQIQAHLPLPETVSHEPAIGEVLALLSSGSHWWRWGGLQCGERLCEVTDDLPGLTSPGG